MTIEEVTKILVYDIGLERVLEDNDITEEELVMLLISSGIIDTSLHIEEEYYE